MENTNQILDLTSLRKQKLDQLRRQENPFKNNFIPADFIPDLLKSHGNKNKQQLTDTLITAKIAGRIILKRLMGKASFITIAANNTKIQIYVRSDTIGAEEYQKFNHLDLADIIGITGTLFKTNTDELSIRAEQVILLTKSLRPLPEKHKGLLDKETCYRKRYLDLIANPLSKQRFLDRANITENIRTFFNANQFLEVETPMMHSTPGGATAKPFTTHHNALNMQLYLRIAPELYLKRLIVGGFERIFEINRNFRNEGLSSNHNPEFTMLEFYLSYASYTQSMALVESLIGSLAQNIAPNLSINYQEHEINFSAPFQRMSLQNAVITYNQEISKTNVTDTKVLTSYANKLHIHLQPKWGWGKILLEIFEKTVERKLIQPTFITDYPTEVSPLARVNDTNKSITERFELFIAGMEIANGFSELNDPEEQAQRFKDQQLDKDSGDDEAMTYDSDYIEALEHGMPPTTGTGIGIDRLVMLLTDAASIRDVLLFPLMRLVDKNP